MHRVALAAFLLVALPSLGLSQDPGGRTLQASRLSPGDVLGLDGVPDEPAWRRADVATDFLQRDPDNGAAASERTEVRLLYEASRLIIAVICHDSEPERVLGNQMQRDQSFDADDRFMWTIDTFMDGRSGYYFEINPSGAMGDGLIDPSQSGGFDGLGAGVNNSWDGIWLARVRRSPTGWTAEIEIPFRTLNFDPDAASWGINFQRTVRRKNEESLWTGHARNQGLAQMTHAGRLVGFSGLSHGLGLDLKPYVVGNVSSAPGRGRPGALSTGDVGLDLFYNVTSAVRANFSINTDFAETEVDERRVNLTRFPLFFEEKRDFFLEGSSFFDFSREDDESVVPFFSRRIGLDVEGAPQRIDFGAKLTGQAGAFDIGTLQVRTAESHGLAGEDFSVVRMRRRLLRQSYVGGLYTRRAARLSDVVNRHTAGIDFQLQTATFREDRNLALSGFYVWTSNPVGSGESAGYGLRLAYPNDPFSAEIAVRELQPNYDPAVGFVARRGYKRLNPSLEFAPRLRSHPWIRGFEFSFDLDIQNDADNRPLTREFELTPFEVNFHDGSRLAFDVTPQYERLEEDFEISDGVILPAGQRYEFTRYQIGGSTADHRMVALNGDVSFGDFYSGSRREYVLAVAVRPRRGVAITFEGEHNVLELAEGSFDADVIRALVNTQFSPWLSVVNNLQYDTVSRLLGWQARVRWIQRPGNDLYFVYTHNWRDAELSASSRRFETLDNRLASKLVYTMRF